jgi:hypothetical protein
MRKYVLYPVSYGVIWLVDRVAGSILRVASWVVVGLTALIKAQAKWMRRRKRK